MIPLMLAMVMIPLMVALAMISSSAHAGQMLFLVGLEQTKLTLAVLIRALQLTFRRKPLMMTGLVTAKPFLVLKISLAQPTATKLQQTTRTM